MEIKTIGIVGHGAFGALVHTLLKRFAPKVQVKIFARHEKADGKTFFSLSEVAKSDAVILAVPIHAYEEAIREVVPLMSEHGVVVDVATVKMHTINLLKKMAKGKRWIAAHPVWGPESYEKSGGDVTGFRIVMCDGTLEVQDYSTLTNFLKKCGFNVVEMSADEHDKYIAETLFLTHFVGQILARVGVKRTNMDTVSFGWIMDAVESVQHDQELFKDVYKYNPYCKEVIKRFDIGEAEVQELLL